MDGGKFLPEPAKGKGQLVFNGSLGNIQPFGDLLIADLVDPAQDEHLPASIGQARKGQVDASVELHDIFLKFHFRSDPHTMGGLNLDLVELSVPKAVVAFVSDGPVEIGLDVVDLYLSTSLPIIDPDFLHQVLGKVLVGQ